MQRQGPSNRRVSKCRDLVIWKVSGFSVSLPARAVLAWNSKFQQNVSTGAWAQHWVADTMVLWAPLTAGPWSAVTLEHAVRPWYGHGWHLTMAHLSIRTQLGETTHNEGLGAAPSKSSPELSISVEAQRTSFNSRKTKDWGKLLTYHTIQYAMSFRLCIVLLAEKKPSWTL